MIDQAARGGDQDIDPAVELLHLGAETFAADQQRHGELVVFTVDHEILGDLRGQFPGRGQDQRTRHPRPGPALGQDVDHRQGEARGLAGARLGTAENVPSHQDERNSLFLDRRGLLVAGIGDGVQNFVGKPEFFKCHEIDFSVK